MTELSKADQELIVKLKSKFNFSDEAVTAFIDLKNVLEAVQTPVAADTK